MPIDSQEDTNSPIKFRGGIIFDFDGVLADTEHVALKIMNRYAKLKNVPVPSREFLRNSSSDDVVKALNVRFWELPYAVYLSRKWSKEEDPVATLFSWSENLIKSANEIFGESWVVSSNSTERICLALKKANISFDENNIYGNVGFFSKSRYIKKILNKNNLNVEHVIYVGDETRDILASHKANIKCISVGWGFQSVEILKSLSPEFVLEDPCKFEELLLGVKNNLLVGNGM